ncbi:MAG: hypothetical protein Pg6A_19530 [Termitinemataceae bacterium]|nr:MAG: hypothetical protein Pg6A_19530 [Termitinemataceae bacterium]
MIVDFILYAAIFMAGFALGLVFCYWLKANEELNTKREEDLTRWIS